MSQIETGDKIEVILKREETPVELENEISLREILEALIRRKNTIIKVLVVTLLAGLLFTSLTNPDWGKAYVAQVIISLNYDGIEKGLDPHGQRFDIGKIKSPYVLRNAITKLPLDSEKISVDDLRNNLEIEPIVPGAIVDKIQALIEATPKDAKDIKNSANISNMEEYVYYPNRYKLVLSIPKQVKLDEKDSEQILQAIVDSYIEYFHDTYSDRAVLADAVQKINYADYDYPEVPLIMRNQITLMESYLTAKNLEAPDYRSKTTGLSFNDINESLKLIETMDINKLNSIISSYRITKNKDDLLKTYDYRVKNYEVKMAKSLDESRQSQEIMNKFQKEKSVLFMGGEVAAGATLESEKSNPVYDELAQRSLEAGVEATNTQHDIEFIKREMEIYQNDVEIDAQTRQQKTQQVADMIQSTDKKLRTWINLTNKTLDDYFENVFFKNAVMQPTPVQVNRPWLAKLPMNLAISLVLGLMIGVFAALFLDYWNAKREELGVRGEE